MSECNVCVLSFNKVKRTKVTCPRCGFEACRECVSRYILDQGIKCMSCGGAWGTVFLVESFPKSWINNEYEIYLTNRTVDRLKAMVPEMVNDLAQLHSELIRMRESEVSAYIEYLAMGFMEEGNWQTRASLHACLMDKMYHILVSWNRKHYSEFRIQATDFIRDHHHLFNPNRMQEVEEVSESHSCPRSDCVGSLVSWRCNLCETRVCHRCHDVRGDKHECDPDQLETVKLIRKETKPCPKCKVSISKVSGCDQMWCTRCSTAFSWKTGKVENGPIHNPHYFEQMFANAERRQRELNPCELIDADHVSETTHPTEHKVLVGIRHTADVIQSNARMVRADHRFILMNHIIRPMDDNEWFARVKCNEKRNRVFSQINEITQTLCQTVRELLTLWHMDGRKASIMEELHQLRYNANKAIIEILRYQRMSRVVWISPYFYLCMDRNDTHHRKENLRKEDAEFGITA